MGRFAFLSDGNPEMTLKSDEKAPHLHNPDRLLSRLSNICKHNPVVRMITIIHGERRKSVREREKERESERERESEQDMYRHY